MEKLYGVFDPVTDGSAKLDNGKLLVRGLYDDRPDDYYSVGSARATVGRFKVYRKGKEFIIEKGPDFERRGFRIYCYVVDHRKAQIWVFSYSINYPYVYEELLKTLRLGRSMLKTRSELETR